MPIISRRRLAAALVLVTISLQSGCLTAAQLARLADCESGGNPAAVSASGTYRGKYQFSRTTWNAVAREHAPHLIGVDPARASEADQDTMARHLHAEHGAGQWPLCGRRL